ncbi:fibronectin type III domain-containing protein [Pedobacter ureilyticus]|uniref:Fibronectin type III domain-containing protein n=1 Tax=Pedobacter ureilyticus TaxID=1393051 RepID=A0ABW9J8Y8_9SPHI|nr:fibronectin type III domain-containing protein [Pedobacter helvus]
MKKFKIFTALLLLVALIACKKSNDADTTTCAAPTLPTVTAITATTATLNWAHTNTPLQWQIKYGAQGFNVNKAGISIFTPTIPYTLNPPLTPATNYDYYVRAVCASGDASEWSPVTTFTTLSAASVTCAVPTMPTTSAITATTALLNWTQPGTPLQWQIKYGVRGFNVNTAGTSIITSSKPYMLNPPLTPATAYDYYVRAICGAGDTSAWSAVATFTTK